MIKTNSKENILWPILCPDIIGWQFERVRNFGLVMCIYLPGFQEHSGSDVNHSVDGHAAAESTQRDADSLDQHHYGWTSRTEV